MCVPNFAFVALPVLEILGGTLKKFASRMTGPRPILGKNN